MPKCGDCGTKLRGMKALRPNQLKNSITSKRQKHVTRAYGGARSLSPAPPSPLPLSLSPSLVYVYEREYVYPGVSPPVSRGGGGGGGGGDGRFEAVPSRH